MTEVQYRAELDASVAFSNGGGLSVEGFRVDVPRQNVDEAEVAGLLVASLGLLMTERVEVRRLRVFAEAHKGTRGGPGDAAPSAVAGSWRCVELSHVIAEGMTTYLGLPGPSISAHLDRAASRELYAPGTEFLIDRISMAGNTGTYLESPFHRYANGVDLAGVPLTSLVDLPAVVVRTAGSAGRAVGVGTLAAFDVRGRAVLLNTGGDQRWGTPAYAQNASYLDEAGARWLVEHEAALVGIDSVNIDCLDADTEPGGRTRPAHSLLLGAGIPLVENLTALDQLPPHGARFTAAPPRLHAVGAFPVRAYALVPVRPDGGVSKA